MGHAWKARTALQKPRRTLTMPPSAQCVLGRIPTINMGPSPQARRRVNYFVWVCLEITKDKCWSWVFELRPVHIIFMKTFFDRVLLLILKYF